MECSSRAGNDCFDGWEHCIWQAQTCLKLGQNILTAVSSNNLEKSDESDISTYGKNFLTIEFKWPSEHKIEGKEYDFQISLIFTNSRHRDNMDLGKSVIAVVFAEIGDANTEVQKYVNHLPNIKAYKTPFDVYLFNATLTLSMLFPSNKSFFHYKGSGTIPPCLEPVDVRVYKHPITVSQAQIEKFKELKYANGNLMLTSRRELQDLRGRDVKYVEF
ncbi:hypothetical protein HELRODRAFT_173789 [Helobdella robusta]|uniref:carbonic anhydrase n=1 Tax=Helobdella robusta TaxID=6412 RepID=T1F783_HELRO|nr:hypothetical protein HELRODRAFT_173789 [Helobdella robusta]ESO03486.1 hypothetical protein HELRODRAFT_173789 [Helobdella robusta]